MQNGSDNSTTAIQQEPIHFNITLKVVSTLFLIIIIILSLVGNTLVIAAFALFSKLRTVTNHFVVSLAVTDILVALFSMPMWAAYLLTGPLWMFHKYLRRIWSCMDVLCGVASITHLCFISLERYHDIITSKKSVTIIALIWLFSTMMAVAKYVLWGWPPPDYQLSAFVLCFALPVLIMSTAYIMIFKVSRTQAKRMTVKVNGKSKRFCLPKELKAAKTLGVVMTAFLACWFPFFLLNIIYALDRSIRINPETILIAKWLHYLNSLLNPVIYSCMNRDFRAAFKRLATRFFGRISGNQNQLDRNLGTSRGMSLSGTQTRGPSYKQKSMREEAV